MSTPLDVSQQPFAAAPERETRPLYWSVRREIWENRSIYIAPLIVFAFVLVAALIGMSALPGKLRAWTPGSARALRTFSYAPSPIMLATFLVGFFYSIDALFGERRDRSILFWKSLPVSDRTTVLSKIAVPLVVLPSIAYALSVVIIAILMITGTLVLIGSGLSPLPLWTEAGVLQEPLIMAYGLAVHALWFLPINAYLLLVSAWAKRAPFLWAFLPIFLIGMVERMVSPTTRWAEFLKGRFMGAMFTAFEPMGKHQGLMQLHDLTPVRFLTTPALWLGLLFSALCVIAAVRLRRNREPI